MRFAIIILCTLILQLLTAVLPIGKGMNAQAMYYSPMFILLLALLSGRSMGVVLNEDSARPRPHLGDRRTTGFKEEWFDEGGVIP